MELHKVIDESLLQIYNIVKPDKQWKSVFPYKYVYIYYDIMNNNVFIKQSNDFDIYKLLDICTNPMSNYFAYVFTTEPISKLKRLTSCLYDMKSKDKNKYYVDKTCGLNPANPELFTKENNVMFNILSKDNFEYPPTFIHEHIYVLSNYDEIINENKKAFNKCINNIVNKDIDKQIESNKHSKYNSLFVKFIIDLKNNFPLNYNGSIRRFSNKITSKDFITKGTNNNETLKFYIGYDSRDIDSQKENSLVKTMETITDTNKNNWMIIYETYNNPIKNIIDVCNKNNIEYKIVNKKSILIRNNKYSDLAKHLITSISDFV